MPFEPGDKAPRGALQITPQGKPIVWRKDYILDIGGNSNGNSYPITTATYKGLSVKSQWVIGEQQNKKACCPLLCPACAVRRQFGTIGNPGNYNYSFVNSSWCACTPRLMNLKIDGVSGPPYFGYWYATKQYSYDSTFNPNGSHCLRYSYYNTKYGYIQYEGTFPAVNTTTDLFSGKVIKSNTFANLTVTLSLDCSQIVLPSYSSDQSSQSQQSFSSQSSWSSNSSSSSKSSHHHIPHDQSGTSSSQSSGSTSSASSWSSASSASSESSNAPEPMFMARVCAQICVQDGAGAAFGSWSMCGADNDGYDPDDPNKYWVVGETPVPLDFARAWQNLFNGKNNKLSRRIPYDTFYLLQGFCDRKFNWTGTQSNHLAECYTENTENLHGITVCHTNGSGGTAEITFAGPDECPDCQYQNNEYWAKVACIIEWVMDSYDNGVTWQYKRAYLSQQELDDYPNPPRELLNVFGSEEGPPLWEWDVWTKQVSPGYCRAVRYQLLGRATLNAWCDGIQDAIDNPPDDYKGDGKPCFPDQESSSSSSHHSSQSSSSSSSSKSSGMSSDNSSGWGPYQTSHTSDGAQSSGHSPSSSSSHNKSSWSSETNGRSHTSERSSGDPSSADPSSQSTGSPSSYSSFSSKSSNSSSSAGGGGADNNSSSSSSQSGCECFGVPFGFDEHSSGHDNITINSQSVGCASGIFLRGGDKTRVAYASSMLPDRTGAIRRKRKKCHRLYVFDGVSHDGTKYNLTGVTPTVVRTDGRKSFNAYSGPFHSAKRFDEPSPGTLLSSEPFWFAECGIGGWAEIVGTDNWWTPTVADETYIYQYAHHCGTLPAAGVTHKLILYVRFTRTHSSLADSSIKLLAVHGTNCTGGGVVTPVGSESQSSKSSASSESSSSEYKDTHGQACNDCSKCLNTYVVNWNGVGTTGASSTVRRFGGPGTCYFVASNQSDITNPLVRQVSLKCNATYWTCRIDFLNGTYYELRTDGGAACPDGSGIHLYANTRDNADVVAIITTS